MAESAKAPPPPFQVPTLIQLFSEGTLNSTESGVYKIWIMINGEQQKVLARQLPPTGCCSCFSKKWIETQVWIKLGDSNPHAIPSKVFLQHSSKIRPESAVTYHAIPTKDFLKSTRLSVIRDSLSLQQPLLAQLC